MKSLIEKLVSGLLNCELVGIYSASLNLEEILQRTHLFRSRLRLLRYYVQTIPQVAAVLEHLARTACFLLHSLELFLIHASQLFEIALRVCWV